MNRKLTRFKNGVEYEVPLFPMDVMNITQGPGGVFSHAGTEAIDSAGKDTGIDPIFAPVTMRYITHDSYVNGNCIWFQAVNDCLCADGTICRPVFMFIHDNYIADVIALAQQGHIFKQGEEVLDEGTAGYATGNHSHIEASKLSYSGTYIKNSSGTWQLPNAVSLDKIFVVDGIQLRNNGQPPQDGSHGFNWKTADEIPGISQPVNASGFSDVPENHFAFDAIGWAKRIGLVVGEGNSTLFNPDSEILRGQVAMILWRLSGSPVSNVHHTFPDSKGHYAEEPICWMYENKLTQGTQYFEPDRSVLRCEIAAFIYRYMGEPEVDTTVELPFIDVQTSDWFYPALVYCYQNGLIRGRTDTMFMPYDTCTRGEFCLILYRAFKDVEIEKPETPSTIKLPTYGIDISVHNGDIDLTPYKDQFVIIRSGYWNVEDNYFRKNLQKCEALGIPYGIYHYSYALDTEQAEIEANTVLQLIKETNAKPFMVFLDEEDADGWRKRNGLELRDTVLTPQVHTFCNIVKNAGYKVGLYCSTSWLGYLPYGEYPLWEANYGVDDGAIHGDFSQRAIIHQYTSKPLDKNVAYVGEI